MLILNFAHPLTDEQRAHWMVSVYITAFKPPITVYMTATNPIMYNAV